MIEIVEALLKLQDNELAAKPGSMLEKPDVCRFREKVPVSILGHFNRLIAKGKKGVALVRNGVCSECHLRISSGTLAGLASREDIHLCENCGRYLYMVEQEVVKVQSFGVGEQPLEKVRRQKSPTRKRSKKVPTKGEIASQQEPAQVSGAE